MLNEWKLYNIEATIIHIQYKILLFIKTIFLSDFFTLISMNNYLFILSIHAVIMIIKC